MEVVGLEYCLKVILSLTFWDFTLSQKHTSAWRCVHDHDDDVCTHWCMKASLHTYCTYIHPEQYTCTHTHTHLNARAVNNSKHSHSHLCTHTHTHTLHSHTQSRIHKIILSLSLFLYTHTEDGNGGLATQTKTDGTTPFQQCPHQQQEAQVT